MKVLKRIFSLPEYTLLLLSFAFVFVYLAFGISYLHNDWTLIVLLVFTILESLAPRQLFRPPLNVMICFSVFFTLLVIEGIVGFRNSLETILVIGMISLLLHTARYLIALVRNRDIISLPIRKQYLVLLLGLVYLSGVAVKIFHNWDNILALETQYIEFTGTITVWFILGIFLVRKSPWAKVLAVFSILAYYYGFLAPGMPADLKILLSSPLVEYILPAFSGNDRAVAALIIFTIHLFFVTHPNLIVYFSKTLPSHKVIDEWNFKFFYETNAFRLAGCPIDIRTPEIISNLSDLRMKLIANQPTSSYIPLEFNEVLAPGDVEWAITKLRANTESRIREEVLWFWVDTEDEIETDKGGKKKIVEVLKRSDWTTTLYDYWDDGKGNGVAPHNLAVYWHIKAISRDREEIKINGKKQLSGKSFEIWQKALILWKKAYDDGQCWEYIKRRVQNLGDPGYQPQRVCELKNKKFPLDMILKVNAEIAKRFLQNKNRKKYVSQHISLIIDSGYPEEIISNIMDDILTFYDRRIAEISTYLEEEEITKVEIAVKEIARLYNELEEYNKKIPVIFCSRRLGHFVNRVDTICRNYGGKYIGSVNEKDSKAKGLIDVINSTTNQFEEYMALRLLKEILEELKKDLTKSIERFDWVLSIIRRLRNTIPKDCRELQKIITENIEWAENNRGMARNMLSDINDILARM